VTVGRDEVDRIVADWRREQPDLDLSPLEVLSRVTRLARHLDRDRRAAFAALGLDLGEFDVLAALRRGGEPYEASPGSLSAATMVTSGTMTTRLDKLETRGLVARRTDPDDGRAVIVRLTPQGRTVVDGALAGLLAREQALLGGLDAAEQHTLAALLRRVLSPLDGPAASA
jgi:DNA-binding MarR family transcriptional regulator